MQKTSPRIERERVKIVIPHQGKEINFMYPLVGPNTYREVGKQILNAGMNVPTGDYMASLIHTAYCNKSVANKPEFKNIRDIMENDGLWIFNRRLWSRNGVYVVQDLEAIGETSDDWEQEQLSKAKNTKRILEKILEGGKEISNGVRFSKDGKVRFAPRGSYDYEHVSHKSLAKNGLVIACFGIEGAEKLTEVSSKFKNTPFIGEQKVHEIFVPGQDPDDDLLSFFGYIDKYHIDKRLVIAGGLPSANIYSDSKGYALGMLK